MNNNETSAAENCDDEEIDLFALWETLAANKWLIALIAALCVAAAKPPSPLL